MLRRHSSNLSIGWSPASTRYRHLGLGMALDPGHPSDWCPLNPCQGRSQARSRVYMCRAALPCAVVLAVTDGLDGELASFRIEAPEGWPLLQRRARALDQRWVRVGTGEVARGFGPGWLQPLNSDGREWLDVAGRKFSTRDRFSVIVANQTHLTCLHRRASRIAHAQRSWCDPHAD